MKVIKTQMEGLVLVEPAIFADSRGFFMETYNKRRFDQNGLSLQFVQDNLSGSQKGVLRGLHYQLNPHPMGKFVMAGQGAIFDVAVDLRKGSPTFGKWFGTELNAETKKAVYIPPGFAHGFLSLSDNVLVSYKCTGLYEKSAERTLLWNDPSVGIVWPGNPDPALITDKDKEGALLEKAETNFEYPG